MALTLGLIAIVLGLLWLVVFIACSTSFLWLPIFLVSLPFLSSVALLLRYTSLRIWCGRMLHKVQSEPFKSKVWA